MRSPRPLNAVRAGQCPAVLSSSAGDVKFPGRKSFISLSLAGDKEGMSCGMKHLKVSILEKKNNKALCLNTKNWRKKVFVGAMYVNMCILCQTGIECM